MKTGRISLSIICKRGMIAPLELACQDAGQCVSSGIRGFIGTIRPFDDSHAPLSLHPRPMVESSVHAPLSVDHIVAHGITRSFYCPTEAYPWMRDKREAIMISL
jgi:hypothetical protein